MNNSRKITLSWTPALFCMGVLFWLSSLPGDEVKLPDFWMSDKVIHCMAYACLGWLITMRMLIRKLKTNARLLDISPMEGLKSNWRDGLGQFVGIAYGASDEIHQLFVPMREASMLDWTADIIGILIGSWLCRFLFRKMFRKFSSSVLK